MGSIKAFFTLIEVFLFTSTLQSSRQNVAVRWVFWCHTKAIFHRCGNPERMTTLNSTSLWHLLRNHSRTGTGVSMSSSNYLPGTASLLEELDKRLMVLLRDGRTLIGYLRSVDQFANLVLHRCIERIHVGNQFGDIPRWVTYIWIAKLSILFLYYF